MQRPKEYNGWDTLRERRRIGALERFSRASARDKEKEEDQLRDGWMRLKRTLGF
jgi:hypothetical protein